LSDSMMSMAAVDNLQAVEGVRPCLVCGSEEFRSTPVLWDGLIDEWDLAPHEAAYIDRQQGTRCSNCGCNLRSIVLAGAICSLVSAEPHALPFAQLTHAEHFSRLRVLEVNEAGDLSPWLDRLPHHVRTAFPEIDLQALPFKDESFDVVVHSDTLEHVPDPIRALRECHRVLTVGGSCLFTVPLVAERLTRNREGLPASYHGRAGVAASDQRVYWEFGSDAWTIVARAGFNEIGIFIYEYPAAMSLKGTKLAPTLAHFDGETA
jgi:SAM-dependent methyltransferase